MRRFFKSLFSLLVLSRLICATPGFCDNASVPSSPKQGWGDFEVVEEPGEPSPFRKTLLWIPNRVLDFIDIFRVDVGVGPSLGGSIKVTDNADLTYRTMKPFSLRVGDFGRDWPVKLEEQNDISFGDGKTRTTQRTVCPGEVGAGVDLMIAGAYAGICFDELADFIGGLFLFDYKDDDLR